MKFRPTLIELICFVGITGILCCVFFPRPHHPLHEVKEKEMFGYWVAIPDGHSAYRLFLTNGGSGLLGVLDIHTNLWSVVSWQVTNREISIDLVPITEPEWSHEYIRGKVFFSDIRAIHGGVNQNGEHWKRERIFYREDSLKQHLAAASAIMTNHSQLLEPGVEGTDTNRAPSAAASRSQH